VNMAVQPGRSASRTRSQRAARILLVGGDSSQRDQLEGVLASSGYRVAVADGAGQALASLDAEPPDLALVELDLPDLDGIELGRHIGVRSGCPLIILGDHDDPSKIVEGLDSGADDYVLRPFDIDVLLARVRAALRRRLVAAAQTTDQVLICGDVKIDTGARTVVIGDDAMPVAIVAGQFVLLAALARNQRRVMENAELSRVLWGFDGPDDPDRALRVAISKLRRSLGTGPQRPRLETHHRVGYRLVAPPR